MSSFLWFEFLFVIWTFSLKWTYENIFWSNFRDVIFEWPPSTWMPINVPCFDVFTVWFWKMKSFQRSWDCVQASTLKSPKLQFYVFLNLLEMLLNQFNFLTIFLVTVNLPFQTQGLGSCSLRTAASYSTEGLEAATKISQIWFIIAAINC